MKSFSQFLTEASSNERYVKIKQSGHGANIRKINDTTSMFSHRGIVGHVVKGWSRMGGWGYQAGNIRVNGKDIGLNTIHGTHKTMNDAIHNAYMHTAHHMAKGNK
jgi:hypothetical protein